MLKSNRSSNSRGKNISVYLRGEHLKTLELIGKGLGTDNYSRIIQHLLEVTQRLIDSYMKENPEIVLGLLTEESQKVMRNLQKKFKEQQNL